MFPLFFRSHAHLRKSQKRAAQGSRHNALVKAAIRKKSFDVLVGVVRTGLAELNDPPDLMQPSARARAAPNVSAHLRL